MTSRFRFFAVTLLSLWLGACATDPPEPPHPEVKDMEMRAATYRQQRPNDPRHEMIYVLPGRNYNDNGMLVASLRSGLSSEDSELIVQLLSRVDTPMPVVTGGDDAVTAATVERALRDARSKILPGKKMVFVGHPEQYPRLKSLADDIGLELILVPYL